MFSLGCKLQNNQFDYFFICFLFPMVNNCQNHLSHVMRRVGHDWATKQIHTCCIIILRVIFPPEFSYLPIHQLRCFFFFLPIIKLYRIIGVSKLVLLRFNKQDLEKYLFFEISPFPIEGVGRRNWKWKYSLKEMNVSTVLVKINKGTPF